MEPGALNPYAPPRGPAEPGNALAQDRRPARVDFGDILVISWARFRSDPGIVIGATVVTALLIDIPPRLLRAVLEGAFSYSLERGDWSRMLVAYGLPAALQVFLAGYLLTGQLRLSLAVVRHEPERPPFDLLFSGSDRALPMVMTLVLYAVATVAGTMIFVIPGLLLWLGFSTASFFVADTELGPIRALQASWRSLEGRKLQIFFLHVALALLNTGGLLACGLGALVTLPFSLLCCAIVYAQTSQQVHPASAVPGGVLPQTAPAGK